MLNIILTIIPIIISIPAVLVSIRSLRECNNIKCNCEKCNNKKEKNNLDYENIDELIYSMKFNTTIDSLICQLLHKFPNHIIVEEVSKIISKRYNIKSNDIEKIESHVKDMLLNYNNSYKEKIDEHEIAEPNIEWYDSMTKINTLENKPDNITTIDNEYADLTKTLTNFYND